MARRHQKRAKPNPSKFLLLLAGTFFVSVGLAYWIVALRVKNETLELHSARSTHSDYSGSSSCRECHAEIFREWEPSHHALAERDVSASVDSSAFEPAQNISHGTQTSQVRLANGKFQLISGSKANPTNTFDLTRAIGVAPLIQYLTPAAGGRFQTTEIAFDPVRKDWFDIFGDEDRHPGEWGHWTGRGMTWNSMCASCHNTRLQKNYDVVSDTYKTKMAEPGVGCESCHGPMKSHAQWQRKNRRQRANDPTIKRLSRDEAFDSCGACHSRRAELTGDFVPGDSFFDHHQLTVPDETDIFYPDGQVRDEDYEFTSFLSSKMHAAGVRCVDCHNPHSGKTKLPGNLLCLQCHSGSRPDATSINPVSHSFHKPNTPGSACVDCHMPQTTYMQRHPRRDHGFTIPDPLLTKQHGIPNACNRCHTEQSVDWALEHTEKWYGDKMNRPTRLRAQLLAQSRAGETNVSAQLLEILREEKIPVWRASIMNLLRPSLGDEKVLQAVIAGTSDSHPLVRSTAAKVISPLAEQNFSPAQTALRSLLKDPVRSVRIDAAWTIRNGLDTNSLAGRDLWDYLLHNADQPVGALQLGHFFLSRNDLGNALPFFERSVLWDQNSAPLRHDYAVALNLTGRNKETIAQLEEACRLAPQEPEYRYKLALAFNEAGNLSAATDALEQATKLDPQFSRAWYNLGLAYAGVNRLNDALKALEYAEQMDVRSAEIPYAWMKRVGRQERLWNGIPIFLRQQTLSTAAGQKLPIHVSRHDGRPQAPAEDENRKETRDADQLPRPSRWGTDCFEGAVFRRWCFYPVLLSSMIQSLRPSAWQWQWAAKNPFRYFQNSGQICSRSLWGIFNEASWSRRKKPKRPSRCAGGS